MTSVLSFFLGLVTALSAVMSQTINLEVTLTSRDITSVSLSSLFPSTNGIRKGMLGQAPTIVYNSSHPASIISKMGEQGMIVNPIPFGSTNTLDYWAYKD
jgi:hypothetical protein